MKQAGTLVIGVTTYNRRRLVCACARALAMADGLAAARIGVWDDASDEYDVPFLQRLFPGAEVRRAAGNLGSDFNLHRMYVDFLAGSEPYLVNLDSDMIVNPDFIARALAVIDQSDGVVGLYNSFKHPPVDTVRLAGEPLVVKRTVGSAGVVFHRDLLREIVDNVPPSRSYDWDWCRYLEASGRRILVYRRSHVQHIGDVGYNTSGFLDMDYGLGFEPKTPFNRHCVRRVSEELFRQAAALRRLQEETYHFIPKASWVGRLLSLAMRCKRLCLGR